MLGEVVTLELDEGIEDQQPKELLQNWQNKKWRLNLFEIDVARVILLFDTSRTIEFCSWKASNQTMKQAEKKKKMKIVLVMVVPLPRIRTWS